MTVFRSRDLMPGPHTFHLAVDRKRNGKFDMDDLFSDVVTVIVQ